jgi:hypothetical protein
MWKRALMRLLSFSFMSFFIVGLLWEEGRRRDKSTAPASHKRKSDNAR